MTSLAVSDSEYRAATEHCGLVDRSDRGKLALTGSEAKTFLQGQVSNDVEALEPGRGCYAAFLTPKGKMLGDLRILDTGGELLLDTERIALQELFNMIRRFSIGYDAQLHKRTLQQGLLSLLGPDAAAVAGADELDGGEDAHMLTEVNQVAVRAVRTDVGVDLFCDAADTDALKAALEARGARPVAEAVAECVRVERGRPRFGVDLDASVIPQEADLNERAVSFSKGCYVGQETVARLFYRGKPNRRLSGIRLSAPAETGTEIMLGDRVVGRLGSVADSPALGSIALALVRREAPPGSHVTVGPDAVDAVVVDLPFAL
ncbi:MAG TPA: glycine cleavage T C-terminal barrel domain-containing protein [Solirubrobacteraceae bacterium]|nr:glycine cleavage T C-terminal barrel domain-containing protein [Solirubrobacteraceae bacterium]